MQKKETNSKQIHFGLENGTGKSGSLMRGIRDRSAMPIEEGGLGMRPLPALNQAAITYTLSFNSKPEALWTKVLTQRYLSKNNIHTVKTKPTDSPLDAEA